ncbi:MAG: PAS domain-containing protein [Alphaproteobacteria bacterium]|nr:PAS domain-containing protein [Alphaproteobacteria bacterium]
MSEDGKRAAPLSAEFLARILDAIPTPIYAKDAQARFVYSNRRHNELVGRSEDELLGKSDADFYAPEAAAAFLANDRLVLDTGATSSVEEMSSIGDGMTKPVLSHKARMAGAEGESYLVGINFSLTEVKKREEQYRALAETVPVGVVQIEEDQSISFSNPLLHAYFASLEEGLDLPALRKALGQGADFPGQAARFECSLKDTGRGERRVLVISSGWLLLSKNKTRSAIVSIVDISENAELKRINEEILRLNRELASSMQALKDAQDALVKKGRMEQMGQLTATIAHELRNPLGAVRTSVFLVERKIKDKGLGVEPQLQRINNGVTRCDAIITQLLDFSRTKKLECKSGDLDQWLGKCVEEEARRLASCIEVTCYLGLDGREVPFDPVRLQRAVANMISNACEAMVGNGDMPLASQKETPQLTLTTRQSGPWVEIEVADNGPGIAAETIEKIREPLFTTKSFGTGLGVPAIEQIAAQHGGQLIIESELGRGARFIMRLPVAGVANGEAA